MEAVKQGSATVGLKSKTHAILVALKVGTIFLCAPGKKGNRDKLGIIFSFLGNTPMLCHLIRTISMRWF